MPRRGGIAADDSREPFKVASEKSRENDNGDSRRKVQRMGQTAADAGSAAATSFAVPRGTRPISLWFAGLTTSNHWQLLSLDTSRPRREYACAPVGAPGRG